MYFQLKLESISCPRLWVGSNILVNLSMAVLVYLSRSLASIYLSSVWVVIALVL